MSLYRFLEFSTGLYTKHNVGGVCLQFSDIETGEIKPVIYNAEVTRKRNTKKHKAGSMLPNNRFRVGTRHKFYKFWQATGLAMPRHLSEFPEHMSKLKHLTFEIDELSGKLDKDSISRVNLGNSSGNSRESLGKNSGTILGKETEQSYTNKAFQPISSACNSKYGNKNKGNKEVRKQDSPNLNTISNIDINNNEVEAANITQLSKAPSTADLDIKETERVQEQSTDAWLAEYIQRDEELKQQSLDVLDAKFKRNNYEH